MPARGGATSRAGVLRSPYGGAVSGVVGPVGTRPYSKPPNTVVSRFQSGHGWSQSSGNGSVSDDTSEYLFGTQSLKLTTDGAAAGLCSARKTGLTAIDLTTQNIRLWVRLSSTTAVSQILVYASSADFAGNVFASTGLTPSGNYPQLRSGEWACLVFGKEQFTTNGGGGAPAWNSINSFQVSVSDNASGVVTLNVGALDVVPRPAVSYCSFTFDDGFSGVYDEARPIMDAYGYTGTVFIIADVIGNSGFMTMAQLKKLESVGWEVAAHSATLAQHDQATGLLSSDIDGYRWNLLTQRQWLWANGFRGTGLAFPRGANNAAMREETRKVYSYARSVNQPAGSESFPPADPYQLRAHEIYRTTTTSAINTIVDTAVAGNRWAILEFHNINDSPSVSNDFQYSTANFQTVVDHIASTDMVVLPVCDVMAESVNPLV